jgi:hypothetical protein
MVFGMLGRTPHSCGLTIIARDRQRRRQWQYRYDAYLRHAETAP